MHHGENEPISSPDLHEVLRLLVSEKRPPLLATPLLAKLQPGGRFSEALCPPWSETLPDSFPVWQQDRCSPVERETSSPGVASGRGPHQDFSLPKPLVYVFDCSFCFGKLRGHFRSSCMAPAFHVLSEHYMANQKCFGRYKRISGEEPSSPLIDPRNLVQRKVYCHQCHGRIGSNSISDHLYFVHGMRQWNAAPVFYADSEQFDESFPVSRPFFAYDEGPFFPVDREYFYNGAFGANCASWSPEFWRTGGITPLFHQFTQYPDNSGWYPGPAVANGSRDDFSQISGICWVLKKYDPYRPPQFGRPSEILKRSPGGRKRYTEENKIKEQSKGSGALASVPDLSTTQEATWAGQSDGFGTVVPKVETTMDEDNAAIVMNSDIFVKEDVTEDAVNLFHETCVELENVQEALEAKMDVGLELHLNSPCFEEEINLEVAELDSGTEIDAGLPLNQREKSMEISSNSVDDDDISAEMSWTRNVLESNVQSASGNEAVVGLGDGVSSHSTSADDSDRMNEMDCGEVVLVSHIKTESLRNSHGIANGLPAQNSMDCQHIDPYWSSGFGKACLNTADTLFDTPDEDVRLPKKEKQRSAKKNVAERLASIQGKAKIDRKRKQAAQHRRKLLGKLPSERASLAKEMSRTVYALSVDRTRRIRSSAESPSGSSVESSPRFETLNANVMYCCATQLLRVGERGFCLLRIAVEKMVDRWLARNCPAHGRKTRGLNISLGRACHRMCREKQILKNDYPKYSHIIGGDSQGILSSCRFTNEALAEFQREFPGEPFQP